MRADMEVKDAIMVLERLRHTEAKWPGTEETLEALDMAMGYKRLITYILESENGASLKASGWKCVGQAGGLRWTGKRRPEVDLCPAQMKIRWEASCDG